MTEQINYKGILLVLLLIVGLSFMIDIENLKNFISQAGFWAPIFFILLKITTIVVAPISGSPLYPLIGLLFGLWPGLLYVAIGDFLGYSIAFLIGRIFGRAAVEKFISKNENGILAKLINRVSTGRGFFRACLIFFPLPEILSYSAGLSHLKYWKFISILWPASMLVALFLVFLGGAIDFGSQSIWISLVAPLIGLLIIIVASFFFIKDLKKD